MINRTTIAIKVGRCYHVSFRRHCRAEFPQYSFLRNQGNQQQSWYTLVVNTRQGPLATDVPPVLPDSDKSVSFRPESMCQVEQLRCLTKLKTSVKGFPTDYLYLNTAPESRVTALSMPTAGPCAAYTFITCYGLYFSRQYVMGRFQLKPATGLVLKLPTLPSR